MATKYNIHIGDRFGKLSVITEPYKDKNKYVVTCKCDCGKEVIHRPYDLLHNISTRCASCSHKGKTLHSKHYCTSKRKVNINPGDRFGKLVIIQESSPRKSGNAFRRYVLCRCDCGNFKEVQLNSLLKGLTTSCGCKYREKETSCNGLSITKLHGVWRAMKQRCYNSKCKAYAAYGGRGITICDDWLHNFLHFYNWSISSGYEEETLPNGRNRLTIDRIDVNGNYCPENCRWVTDEVQQKNKRNNHKSKN